MGSLRDWWNRMFGRDEPPHVSAPPTQRPAKPAVESTPGMLELGEPPPVRKSSRGSAGFDPYGNDAGYTKPGGWDHVDRD